MASHASEKPSRKSILQHGNMIASLTTTSLRSLNELKALRFELYAQVQRALEDEVITTRNLWTILGILNSFEWSAATKFGAVTKKGEEIAIDRDRLNELLSISQAGFLEISTSTKHLNKHLRINWPKANRGIVAVRKCRRILREWGLYFYLEGEKSVTVTPLMFRRVDFIKMLVLSEVCETILLQRCEDEYLGDRTTFDSYGNTTHHDNLELLPKHRGASTMLLFNAVFDGVAEYRRTDDSETLSDRPLNLPAPAKAPRSYKKAFTWKSVFSLPMKSWKTMMDNMRLQSKPEIFSVCDFWYTDKMDSYLKECFTRCDDKSMAIA